MQSTELLRARAGGRAQKEAILHFHIFLKFDRYRKLIGICKLIYKVKGIRSKVVTQSVFGEFTRRNALL